jgi:predicted secreted protein
VRCSTKEELETVCFFPLPGGSAMAAYSNFKDVIQGCMRVFLRTHIKSAILSTLFLSLQQYLSKSIHQKPKQK